MHSIKPEIWKEDGGNEGHDKALDADGVEAGLRRMCH